MGIAPDKIITQEKVGEALVTHYWAPEGGPDFLMECACGAELIRIDGKVNINCGLLSTCRECGKVTPVTEVMV